MTGVPQPKPHHCVKILTALSTRQPAERESTSAPLIKLLQHPPLPLWPSRPRVVNSSAIIGLTAVTAARRLCRGQRYMRSPLRPSAASPTLDNPQIRPDLRADTVCTLCRFTPQKFGQVSLRCRLAVHARQSGPCGRMATQQCAGWARFAGGAQTGKIAAPGCAGKACASSSKCRGSGNAGMAMHQQMRRRFGKTPSERSNCSTCPGCGAISPSYGSIMSSKRNSSFSCSP